MNTESGFRLRIPTLIIIVWISIFISSDFCSKGIYAELQSSPNLGTIYQSNKEIAEDSNPKSDDFALSNPIPQPEQKILEDKTQDSGFRKSFNSIFKKLLKNSEQILIVVTKDWNAAQGNLCYYEKKKDKWLKASNDINMGLGYSGLGWGSGLINFEKSVGPVKHEGDGRSPAGVFNLSYSFGYLPIDSLSWLKYPYKQVTTNIECVDDTTSKYYNTLVDVNKIPKTWKRSERMRGVGNHYKYGIIVEHNSNPPIPGCGSCIFIHVWEGLGKSSSGCTTLSEEEIIRLLRWLDAKKNPLLIQLPEIEYNKVKPLLGF